MRKIFFFFFIAIIVTSQEKQVPSFGSIDRIEKFQSKYIKERNIDIWLPDNYNPKNKYRVIYMHDGQMLFDATHTWNHTEWMADETLANLLKTNAVENAIIVGIWNISERRYEEYFPEKVIDYLEKPQKDSLLNVLFKHPPMANNYLKFIVKELKPYIDAHYSTKSQAKYTTIMGSSMGGLISLYAACEYPEIFGNAACISTHLPLVSASKIDSFSDIDRKYASKLREYLNENLPKANRIKFYFDYGNKTLDAYYKPYQDKVDTMFTKKGYDNEHFISLFFENDDHSERSWSQRLYLPFLFLLKK